MSFPLNRRQFLAGSAAFATASLIRRPILSARDAAGRLNVAFIGTGNQGMGMLTRFLQWDLGDVVAVCDVNQGSYGYREESHFYGREPAAQLVNETVAKQKNRGNWKGCDSYRDFREVLARPDIDAVFVIVPDHWHSEITIRAARAGKHVYCEKPLSLTVEEGRRMVDVVRETGIVCQTGSQERSRPASQLVCEAVKAGAIGRVHTVKTVVGFNNKIGPGPGWSPQPVPDTFDYQMWLGPAPYQPYHQDRCLYRFRFHYDYSGGQITNFGAHSCDIAQWGLNRDKSGPVEIVCNKAEFLPEGSLFNTATVTDYTCKYEDGVQLQCISSEPKVETRFEGSDGWIKVGYGGVDASRPELIKGFPGFREAKGEIDAHSLHMKNFVEAIAGKATLHAPVEIGHASANLCHMANAAIRSFPKLGSQVLRWDLDQERFVDNDSANQYLSRTPRNWET